MKKAINHILRQDLVSVRGNVHHSFDKIKFGTPQRVAISSAETELDGLQLTRYYLLIGSARLPVYANMKIDPIHAGSVSSVAGSSSSDFEENVISITFKKRRAVNTPIEDMNVSFKFGSREMFLNWYSHLAEVLADTKIAKSIEVNKKGGILSTETMATAVSDVSLLLPAGHMLLKKIKLVANARRMIDDIVERAKLQPSPVTLDEVSHVVGMVNDVPPLKQDRHFQLLQEIDAAGVSISSEEVSRIFTELAKRTKTVPQGAVTPPSSPAKSTTSASATTTTATATASPVMAPPLAPAPSSSSSSSSSSSVHSSAQHSTSATAATATAMEVAPAVRASANTRGVARSPRAPKGASTRNEKGPVTMSWSVLALIVTMATVIGMGLSSYVPDMHHLASPGSVDFDQRLDDMLSEVSTHLSVDQGPMPADSTASTAGFGARRRHRGGDRASKGGVNLGVMPRRQGALGGLIGVFDVLGALRRKLAYLMYMLGLIKQQSMANSAKDGL